MLSFPKVAKNIDPLTDKKNKDFTWSAETNLVTTHTKTEKNERAEVDGRSHPHHSMFNDFNFRSSASSESISQNKKIATNGGDALSLHTAGQACTGANGVSSTLSSAANEIISQDFNQNQANSRQKQNKKDKNLER